ncbi:MAG: transporter substrate-binding protein [Thermomicrobiales bacterium]|jgi:ABC-type glycerol-3-phosphate transport system substrate-binding protein|nr:transporter substrate-binding protein [Thermomicrobiales bacterium]
MMRHTAKINLPLLFGIVVLLAPMLVSLGAGRVAAQDATPAVSAYDPDSVQAWLDEIRAQYEGETIVMSVSAHPSTTAFQETIKPFEEATGVTVEFDVLEEGAMLEKQLLECSSMSDTYDIYQVAVEAVTQMAETGCIVPLDDRVASAPAFYDFEDLMPAYRDIFTVNDQTYAVPTAGESVFLIYRKDLFDAAGLEPPETWDELLEIAKQFDEAGEVDGVAFRAQKGWQFTYTYSIFLFPFGGMMLDPETGEVAIDSPESAAALDFMRALKPYAPVGIESFSFPESFQSMQNGDVAMLVEATAAGPVMEDPEQSSVAGKLGYTILPAGPAGAYTGVWGWSYGINAASEKQDLAWAVMTWLTSRYTHQDYLNAGGIVSRSSAFDDPANREQYPYFEATGQALAQAGDLAAKGLSVVPKSPLWTQMSDIMGNYGSEAFVDQMTSAEAVARMQEDIEAVFAEQGS